MVRTTKAVTSALIVAGTGSCAYATIKFPFLAPVLGGYVLIGPLVLLLMWWPPEEFRRLARGELSGRDVRAWAALCYGAFVPFTAGAATIGVFIIAAIVFKPAGALANFLPIAVVPAMFLLGRLAAKLRQLWFASA